MAGCIVDGCKGEGTVSVEVEISPSARGYYQLCERHDALRRFGSGAIPAPLIFRTPSWR